ncbi:MAG: hypothetical protein MI717_13575 [Spirochaetales bacterium]|nr:hypothetical protein [Spirochaetales bacterium]
MILTGIDEAALGPNLGPFCAVSISFHLKEHGDKPPNLYTKLKSVVSSETGVPHRLPVGDSKKLYNPRTGLSTLERSVTAFLTAAGVALPCSLASLLRAICPLQIDPITTGRTPWMSGWEEVMIPAPPDDGVCAKLIRLLEKQNIQLARPQARFVPASLFNDELDAHQGKAGALRSIISPLLAPALLQEEHQRHVTVDRQGGRRYYGEWLMELMPGAPLRSVEEGPKRSAYNAGNTYVSFLVGADAQYLEVALASMMAKYLRERAMELFNRYWQKQLPGLKATAGYPTDAKRFLAALEEAQLMPEKKAFLVRRL